MRILFIIILLSSSIVYAGTSLTKNWAPPSPPINMDEASAYNYLQFLYDHFNVSQIVTTNPSGNVSNKAGSFLLYNNSGTWKVCFETAQPSGTTWKCANLT